MDTELVLWQKVNHLDPIYKPTISRTAYRKLHSTEAAEIIKNAAILWEGFVWCQEYSP